jgi:ketosteroid isomerase-like protein
MQSATQLRERFLQAVAGDDVAAVVACYHPDAVLTAPEGRYAGRDYIEAYYRLQFRAFTGGGLRVVNLHDLGETLVGEWVFHATNTGPLELPDGETLPPTGREVTQRGADIAIVRDGLILDHRLYYDQLELIQQLEGSEPQAATSA